MKTTILNTSIALVFLMTSSQLFAQDKVSQVEFDGEESTILTATSANPSVSGTLSGGETAKIECAQGECNLVIDYKGRAGGDAAVLPPVPNGDRSQANPRPVPCNGYRGKPGCKSTARPQGPGRSSYPYVAHVWPAENGV